MDFVSFNYHRLLSPTYMADNGDMWLVLTLYKKQSKTYKVS